MSDQTIARPVDDYDPNWVEWNRQNPNVRRSVGAMAADGDADAGADGGGDADGGAADGADGGDGGSASADGDKKAVNASQDGQDKVDAGAGGGDAGGDGGGTGDDKAAVGDTDVAPWREAIKDEKVRKFADGYRTPTELAEAAFGLRQKVSAAIVKPGKDATDADIAAFRKAMDIPETADGYEAHLSEEMRKDEGGKEIRGKLFKVAHEVGVSGPQLSGILDWYKGEAESRLEAANKKAEAETQKRIDALREEEGNEFEKNQELVKRTFTAFGNDDLKTFLQTKEVDGVPVGNHPDLRQFFITVGLEMQESRPNIALTDEAKGNLEDQHRKLSADINDALDRGDRAEAERLDVQRTAVANKLVGKNPIVGAEGVTA